MMAAVHSRTIPADPGFQTNRSDGGFVSDRPKPRIKPEAMMIAIKNQGTLGQLFNPYSKPPSLRSTRRSGTPEVKRDFIRENTKQIKTIQKSHRESESVLSSRESLRTPQKTDKYEHVESKVAQEVKGVPQAPRSTSKSFLRKHSRSGSPVRDRPVSARSEAPSEDKQSVPRPNSGVAKGKATKVNHISNNIRRVTSSPGPRRRAPAAIANEELDRKRTETEMKYKRGEVPSYLRKRQEQWKNEEDERIKNMPDPSIPPGHTLMPRDERLQTLELLKKKQREMTAELNSLPVSCDTLRIKHRKMELESKLREIENALKIFSRPKVFVKIDS